MSKPGALAHEERSPTASTVGNVLFGASGVIAYNVTMQTAFGNSALVEVEAASGDEAALKAHALHAGCKVLHIEPAPRKAA